MVWTISRGFHRDVPQRGLGPAGRAALALAGIARAALALAGLIVGAEGHNRGCRLAGLACDRADVAGLGLGALSLGGLAPAGLGFADVAGLALGVAALVVGAEGEGGGFRLPLLLSGWSLRPWAILGVADSSEGFSCVLTWTASPRVDRTGPFRKWQ